MFLYLGPFKNSGTLNHVQSKIIICISAGCIHITECNHGQSMLASQDPPYDLSLGLSSQTNCQLSVSMSSMQTSAILISSLSSLASVMLTY